MIKYKKLKGKKKRLLKKLKLGEYRENAFTLYFEGSFKKDENESDVDVYSKLDDDVHKVLEQHLGKKFEAVTFTSQHKDRNIESVFIGMYDHHESLDENCKDIIKTHIMNVVKKYGTLNLIEEYFGDAYHYDDGSDTESVGVSVQTVDPTKLNGVEKNNPNCRCKECKCDK